MSSLFQSDDWVISTARTENGALVIRSRSRIPDKNLRSDHGFLVLINWTYEPTDGGMPDEPTLSSMNGLEDALDVALSDNWGIEAASITGAGSKEWRYYTPDPGMFAAEFSQSLAGHPPYPIELSAFEDPDWEGLAELLPTSEA